MARGTFRFISSPASTACSYSVMQRHPFPAQHHNVQIQLLSQFIYDPLRYIEHLAHRDRPIGTIQVKQHLVTTAHDMNMRRIMIVRIDYDAKAIDT